MKRIVLAALAVVALALPASAAVKDYKTFTADVPDGWQAMEQQGSAAFVAPDGTAAVTVTVQPAPPDADPAVLLKTMSDQMKGTAPKEANGRYSFNFETPQGAKGDVISAKKGDKLLLITVSYQGDPATARAIADSVKF